MALETCYFSCARCLQPIYLHESIKSNLNDIQLATLNCK